MLLVVACAPSAKKGERAQAPTWHSDVQRIVDTHCTRCHQAEGTAPVDLTTRAAVEQWSDRMLERMLAGEMPPPVSEPDCRDYVGSEHLSLPADAVVAFEEWMDAGMPEGDPADSTAATIVTTELSEVDLTVQLPIPHRPFFDDTRNPNNEYRCFALEHGQDEPFFITALGPQIDAIPLVHHIVVYVDNIDDIPEHDPEEGWDCIDNMAGLDEGMIAGWAPGALPFEFPEGTGYRIEPNERIILQMHYYDGAPDQPDLRDQSGYDFRITDSVDTELIMVPYGTYNFSIPAGDPAYTYGFELELPESFELDGLEIPVPDFTIYGVFPHMHVLGSGYELTVTQEDGTEECVVRSDKYDFNNQLTYDLKEPVVLGPGDKLWWSCTWDNSATNPDQMFDPPVEIGYGERTDQEMCWAFTLGALTF